MKAGTNSHAGKPNSFIVNILLGLLFIIIAIAIVTFTIKGVIDSIRITKKGTPISYKSLENDKSYELVSVINNQYSVVLTNDATILLVKDLPLPKGAGKGFKFRIVIMPETKQLEVLP